MITVCETMVRYNSTVQTRLVQARLVQARLAQVSLVLGLCIAISSSVQLRAARLIVGDSNIPGQSFYSTSYADCCLKCSQNANCGAYTLNQNDQKKGYAGKCLLKYSTGWNTTSSQNMISGTVPRSTGTIALPASMDMGCQCSKLTCPSGYSGSWGARCADKCS